MHSHYSIGRRGTKFCKRTDGGDICGGCGGCSIGGLDNELADWPTRRAKGSSGQVLSGQSAVESVIRRANNGKGSIAKIVDQIFVPNARRAVVLCPN
uniref:Uncharacterized protein n=1 Tax=Globodera rostochiensis TaxID=31243 RepID=A0A914IBM2_GLORO